MSEEKIVWMTFCRDNEEIDPFFQIMGHPDKQAREEYREKRKLGKLEVVKQIRVVCNIDGCDSFAEVILEHPLLGIRPEFEQKNSIRVGGSFVSCVCKKHHARLVMHLSTRVLTLEDRVDEMSKELESMYDIFEYKD